MMLFLFPVVGGIGSILSLFLFGVPAEIAMPIMVLCVVGPIIIGVAWVTKEISKDPPCSSCGAKGFWQDHKHSCPEYQEPI
jgi:hypothetical protein